MEKIIIRETDLILDFGVGTGEMSVIIKKSYPKAQIFGLDIDPGILKIARKKLNKAQCNDISISLYDGTKFPFTDNYFDKVIVCLVFCNLTNEDKKAYLLEIFRILKIGGSLHICDFGYETSSFKRTIFYCFRYLTPLRFLLDDSSTQLQEQITSSGFKEITNQGNIKIITGTLMYYKATK